MYIYFPASCKHLQTIGNVWKCWSCMCRWFSPSTEVIAVPMILMVPRPRTIMDVQVGTAHRNLAVRHGMCFLDQCWMVKKGGQCCWKSWFCHVGVFFLNMIYRTLSKIIKIYWELLMSNLLKVGCLWFCHSCFYVKYHATIRFGFWQTPQEVEENIDRGGSRVRGVAMKPPDGLSDGC